jgi:hypothetical protein
MIKTDYLLLDGSSSGRAVNRGVPEVGTNAGRPGSKGYTAFVNQSPDRCIEGFSHRRISWQYVFNCVFERWTHQRPG